MRKLFISLLLAFSLAGCANGFNPLAPVTNPVSNTNLYQGELVFDAALKTFLELKGLCANRTLPSVCRTYVKQGQSIIGKIYAADKAARVFIKNNPTLDATNVVQAFTNLVYTFNNTVTQLSTIR